MSQQQAVPASRSVSKAELPPALELSLPPLGAGKHSEARPFDLHDVMEMRNSIKLAGKATKYLAVTSRLNGQRLDARLLEGASLAAGLLLALSREPREPVIASFLHQAYTACPAIASKIERSFGPSVLCLLSASTHGHGDFVRDREKVDRALQWGRELILLSEHEAHHLPQVTCPHGTYNAQDKARIGRALAFAIRLYEGVMRPWGRADWLPLHTNALDVGLILALAAAPASVVEAGILHDAMEKYNRDGQKQSAIRAQLQAMCGERVVCLIETVTEPREGEGWDRRKGVVVDNLMRLAASERELAREAAMVLCAAKASTLSSGNKYLYEGIRAGEIPQAIIPLWSGAGYEANRRHFMQLNVLFELLQVPAIIKSQFDEELARFLSPGETRNRRYPNMPINR